MGRQTKAAAKANEGARAGAAHDAAAKARVQLLHELPRVLPEQEADGRHVPRRHTYHLDLVLEVKLLVHMARGPQGKAKPPAGAIKEDARASGRRCAVVLGRELMRRGLRRKRSMQPAAYA